MYKFFPNVAGLAATAFLFVSLPSHARISHVAEPQVTIKAVFCTEGIVNQQRTPQVETTISVSELMDRPRLLRTTTEGNIVRLIFMDSGAWGCNNSGKPTLLVITGTTVE